MRSWSFSNASASSDAEQIDIDAVRTIFATGLVLSEVRDFVWCGEEADESARASVARAAAERFDHLP
jgi:hypothetical protein